MKDLIGITVLLSLFMINACSKKVEKERDSELQVISIHELKIKSGVNETEFEAFVMNEIAPLYRQIEGQDLFLAKGYVGQKTGQYVIFITFQTLEQRNKTYLSTGDSEELKKVMEGKDDLWDKFYTMAEGFDGIQCTDYVKVDY